MEFLFFTNYSQTDLQSVTNILKDYNNNKLDSLKVPYNETPIAVQDQNET